MIQIKKTILTLALLLTAATGAWAQSAVASIGSENYTTLQAAFTAAETGQTIKLLSDVTQTGGVGKSDGKAVTFDLNGHIYTCTDDYSVMATYNSQITIIDSSTGTPGGIKSELALVGQENGKIIIKAGRYNIGDLTAEELLEYFPLWGVEMYSGYTLQDITPADAQGFCVGVVAPAPSGPKVAWTELKASDINAWIGDDTALTAADLPGFTAVSDEEVVNIPAPLTNGAIFMIYAFNGTNIKFVNYYNGAQVYKGEDYYNRDNIAYNAFDAGYIIYYTGTASSGPEVAWDKDKKTGTFTMPGGNVTLEPEYYPQAALAAAPTAINDVPATTDGAIVKAGTVKNIGETTTAQGTLMYYVSPSALDDAALLALAADQWTADVPTAKSLAQGQAYVYYYVRGNDGDNDDEIFSDGDILSANALTVTIAAEPTYAVTFADDTAEPALWTADPNTGVKKGQPVTVTYTGSKKVIGVKAEKKAKALITNPVVGQVIGSDGKNYAYGSLPTGVTAVAKICYVSGSNGLALALTDEESKMNWSTAIETCAAHTPAITGGTWKLASKDEWSNMISAAGSHTALRDGFSSVGGTNMKEDYPYWSSTENGSDNAWIYSFSYGIWSKNNNSVGYVRACLAF